MLCITDDLPAPSCDRSKMVKFFPAAVTFISDYFLKESGRHAECVLYGSCVWNRIEKLYHRGAVARSSDDGMCRLYSRKGGPIKF